MRTAASPLKELVYGAFGSGKSTLIAFVGVVLSLSLCEAGHAEGRELFAGAVAPTQKRQKVLVSAFREVCPAHWYKFKKKDSDWSFPALGVTIEIRSSKEQSAETGSPVQGQNWCFALPDELQDQTAAFAHIYARGRSAPDGRYPVICSATAKDSIRWSEFRNNLSKDWHIARLTGQSNIFVPPSFWEEFRRNLSERDAKRMIDALDVGPERAMYPAFSREQNLRPIPRVGAKEITEKVLAGAGPNFTLLLGHDPGTLRNVTTVAKAYQIGKMEKPTWYIVGELATEQTTTEEHAEELRSYLQSEFDVQWPGHDEPKALIRCDPWSKRDAGTDKGIHDELAALGFRVLSAAYTDKGEGRGRIPLKRSAEMLNKLFLAADKCTRRLFFAQNENGKAAAEDTMRMVEVSQWDAFGQKQECRKDDKRKDPTDHTSALRYKFWSYERFRKPMRGGAGMAVG